MRSGFAGWLLATILAVLLVGAECPAQVPQIMNYQGRLISGSNLVNTATSMVFRLYEADVGGTPVYVETQVVVVVDGLYSVSFGGAAGQVTLREAVAHQPLFLEVQVGGTVLSPRERIASAAYALASPGMPWVEVTGTSRQGEPNHGYLANSGSRVTVTLPTNPVVGDVVRLSGAGAGGWKLGQNTGQCVVVRSLGSNTDFNSWVARTGAGSRSWRNIDSSANGLLLCAAVYGGNIYTSSDGGTNWTARETSRNWQGMSCSGDGLTILAGVNGGYLYVSYDGGSIWTSRLTGASRVWCNTAVSYDGKRMAAVAWDGTSDGYIYTSSDSGSNWTARATDTRRQWNGLACSSNGMTLVAGNYGGNLYMSYNGGVTWTARTAVGSGQWWGFASSADGTKLIGGPDYAGFHLLRSEDSGATWTAVTSVPGHDWYCVASSADGNTLLAGDSSATGMLYRTGNGGASWTAASGVATGSWNGAASSADGAFMMAARNGGNIYTLSDPTSDTTTPGPAGYLLGPQFSAIELLYTGGGAWLPLSYCGSMTAY